MAGEVSEAQITAAFKQMRNEQQAIATKISELEIEAHEHNLVIKAIEKLEPSRKCFRLVGGVLVERTVGEVLPAVTKNRDAILDAVKQLQEQLNKKTTELNEFMVKYKIQIRRGDEEKEEKKQSTTSSSAGVLV